MTDVEHLAKGVQQQRKWPQFSLRTIFFAVAALCAIFALARAIGAPLMIFCLPVSVATLGAMWGKRHLRVFCVGFLMGVAAEFTSLSILWSRSAEEMISSALAGYPDHWFPFSLLLQRFMPGDTYTLPTGQLLVDTEPENMMLGMTLGWTVSGILGGLITLVIWYALGIGKLGRRVASYVRRGAV